MAVESFYEWMRLRYTAGELSDIVKHSATQGIPGLTYYTETCLVYDAWPTEMWECLGVVADRVGITELELLSNRWAENVRSNDQFKNCVVWTVVEYLAESILADGTARADEEVEGPPTEERVNTKLGALAAALQRQVDDRTRA
jgi:hypothetical protein